MQSSLRAQSSESGIIELIFLGQLGAQGKESSCGNELQRILAKDSYAPDCAPDAGGTLLLQKREDPRLVLENQFLILQDGV